MFEIDEKDVTKTEEETNEEINLFEDEDNSNPDEKEESDSYVSIFNELKDSGIIEDELPEEISKETLLETIKENFENSVKQQVEESIKDLPDDAKAIINHVLGGGNVNDFLKTYTQSGITLNTDINKEANQIQFMKMMLAEDGYDENEIAQEIEHLKENERLESVSKKRFGKWKQNREADLEEEKQENERERQRVKQEEKAFKEKINSIVKNNDKLGILPLSKIDKEKLPSYMIEKTVRMSNGAYTTKFYSDLSSIVKNEKSFIQLAKIVRSIDKDGNFNLSDIAKIAETNFSKKIKDNIERKETNKPKSATLEETLAWLGKN